MIRSAALALVLVAAACKPADAPAPANDIAFAGNDVAIEESDSALADAGVAANDGVHPEPPEQAPIPAKFRGIWADSRTVCAQLSHPSRLIISGRTVRYRDTIIEEDGVIQPDDDSFTVTGRIKKTGAPAKVRFRIDPTGNILTDETGGGAVRVRCA